jgi:MFS transporter, FHS family, L-fucose permease
MKTTTSSKGNIVAIITMMFLFAMISFVTNLAAPVGVIWKNTFAGGENANTIGMLGNAMNFLAYLFMGIPSGKMLAKIGYKNTAMTGVATGIAGLVLQFLSGTCSSAELGFSIYLLGAFVCGFSVCMLNTVVNPMINLLGGGGNRGNQLNLIGGTLNSLSGTLTPMLVGSLIGEVTKDTKIANVNVVLFIAMAVFAAAFCILYFIKINNPEHKPEEKLAHSPWDFSNFKLGAIAIFLYVGLEVGIPGTLFFYISDTTAAGGGTGLAKATAVAGFVAATYWFLPLSKNIIEWPSSPANPSLPYIRLPFATMPEPTPVPRVISMKSFIPMAAPWLISPRAAALASLVIATGIPVFSFSIWQMGTTPFPHEMLAACSIVPAL